MSDSQRNQTIQTATAPRARRGAAALRRRIGARGDDQLRPAEHVAQRGT